MNATNTYLKKRTAYMPDSEQSEGNDDIRRQIAGVTGTEKFQHRDPIWHLDESFCQSFDLAGQERARESSNEEEKSSEGNENEENRGEGGSDQYKDPKTDFTSKYEQRMDENEPRLGRFAETAFKRGQLSSAVVAGTGKSMFFSCLNRSVGQENAKNRKERKLFQKESLHRLIPGNAGAKLIVNRGEAESAVGLVVDSLKDARWTLKSMQDVAEGKMGGAGAETYRKEYPFLTDKKERELLENYREKLKNTESPKEKQILNSAIIKLEHVIEKKAQMKKRFLDHLRKLQYDALTAEQMFLSEGFLNEVVNEEEAETAANGDDNNDIDEVESPEDND